MSNSNPKSNNTKKILKIVKQFRVMPPDSLRPTMTQAEIEQVKRGMLRAMQGALNTVMDEE